MDIPLSASGDPPRERNARASAYPETGVGVIATPHGVLNALRIHPLPGSSLGESHPWERTSLEAVTLYAELALRALPGHDVISLEGFGTLQELRLALLGARQAGLPVYGFLGVEEDGESEEGDDPLAALICLQALGLSGFGIQGRGEELDGILPRLLPYAEIPLGILPEREGVMFQYFNDGARFASAPEGESAEALAVKLERFTASPRRLLRPEDSPILLADGSGVYYLEEDFSLSAPILGERDLAEEILEQEDLGVDALLFYIRTAEDADHFAANAHLPRLPVCLLSEDPVLLEACLLAYPGRAMIDARSEAEENTLRLLAEGYGAVVR
ncbi:MAG: hypothetical protein ACK5LX_06535 [Oscillospiraceae bacterium]